MPISATDLEQLFAACFRAEFETVLVGGGSEPLYLPSAEPARGPHRILYREDFVASALHEVAHWCLAGARRRRLEDYGYWYSPDGRTAAEQAAFERAEIKPQAIEWIFSDACAFAFNLSADNLDGGVGPSADFEASVRAQKARYQERGLPPRAALFLQAIRGESSAQLTRMRRLAGSSSPSSPA